MNFLIEIDPDGKPTQEQRIKLNISTFLQNFIGTFTPQAALRAAHYGPPRSLKTIHNSIEIFTDGSVIQNGNSNRGGIGIFFGNDDPRNVSESIDEDNITNNRTELMAILRCCQIIERGLSLGEESRNKFTINTDSQYALIICTISCFKWADLNWNINKSNLDIVRQLHAIVVHLGPVVNFRWVKAHAGNPGNTEADRLANDAAHRVTPSHATRRLPQSKCDLTAYIDAKKALLSALAISVENGRARGKNRPPNFTAKLGNFIPDYLIFTRNAISILDNSRLKLGITLPTRICVLCNDGPDNTPHLLDCESDRAIKARSIVPEDIRRQTIQELARFERPPDFPDIRLAHEMGKMAKALLRERNEIWDSPSPRENLIPRPQANNDTAFLFTFKDFTSPKRSPKVGPIWWDEADIATLFKNLGFTLNLNRTENCLCNAITGLLQENGLATKNPSEFAARLRLTMCEFIRTKYGRIINKHRALLTPTDHDYRHDQRLARQLGDQLNNLDELLTIKSVAIAATLFNVSFECITIHDSMRKIDTQLQAKIIPNTGPYIPTIGTLILFQSHWYYLTKG